jgi:hypothetical protein
MVCEIGEDRVQDGGDPPCTHSAMSWHLSRVCIPAYHSRGKLSLTRWGGGDSFPWHE